MANSLFLRPLSIHPSWQPFLTEPVIRELVAIENQIALQNITPKPERVLRFFELDLSTVKVVILGQDPYPQENVATGRAFEVGNLTDWKNPYKNPSLKNIIRSLYFSYHQKILKYGEIWKTEFEILPPNQLFQNWEAQGVMLINTSFTCLIGQSNSHQSIWHDFSQKLLGYMTQMQKNAVWFLWGREAIESMEGYRARKIQSHHPMICYPRQNDFLYGGINPFFETKDRIKWNGIN